MFEIVRWVASEQRAEWGWFLFPDLVRSRLQLILRSGEIPTPGTIPRYMFVRGQRFAQFLGPQLEELPEACTGHLKAKHAVCTLRATPNRTREMISALDLANAFVWVRRHS